MVITPKTILVKKLVKVTRLAGSAMGIEHRPNFVSVASANPDQALCFDWSEIEFATASYLRFAYVPIFRFAGSAPIITVGINKAVEDDLQLALEVEERPALLARGAGTRRRLDILGPLDDAYMQTLEALEQHGGMSSSSLFAVAGNKPDSIGIGKTAWINRLNRLFEMGLISRIKIGKEYQYERIHF